MPPSAVAMGPRRAKDPQRGGEIVPKLFRKLNALTLVALASALVGCSDPSSTDSMAAAKGHMAKQEWSSAVVELKSALQKAPNSGEARYLLGVALLEQGLEAQAAVELGKASEAGFDDEQLAPKLARAWLGTGRPKEVVQTYRKTSLNRAHEQAELKTALAVAYARLNQRAEAEAAVDEALRADPRHPWALVTKARVHASSGKFDEAMKLLDVAMVPGSSNGEAQLLRAALFRIIKKDNESARKAYLQAALDSQTAMQARTALVQMALTQSQLPEAKAELAELKKAYPKHPHVHFVEALVAYAEKDFARTEGIIEQLLRLAPDNPQLLVLGGAANLQRGGLLGAETKLGKVVQTVERMPVARKLLADTYLRAGQPDKALTTLRPLIESARPDGDAMALAGQAHLHAGRPQEAEAHFAAAAKLKPDDVQVKTALALTELVKGQPEAAFDALAQIAAGDTGDTADLALISAFMRRKEFDRALEAIAKLEKKTPTKAVALHLRGLAMRGKRDEPGARGAFEEALKADPLYFASTAALASMEVEARNLDAATTRLEAAVRAAPRNTAARMAHLNVLRAKGEIGRAHV